MFLFKLIFIVCFFIYIFMILIYSSKLVLYILFKHSKISKSFEKQLTLENKVTSYLDYLDYLKS